MGIDWHWIKQRPQIIAEKLARDYDVTVVYYKEVFQKQHLRKDKDELKNSFAIPVIPYRDKNQLAYKIQKRFFNKVIERINEYDMVWLCNPLLYRYIPKEYQGKIIYDCMDNHIALCNDDKIKKSIEKVERELILDAEIIFASSNGLAQKMQNLGGRGKTVLVRNGFVGEEIHVPVAMEPNEVYKIGYFGTISKWMDFSLLVNSLEHYRGLEYHLWGPVSEVLVPDHPRLIVEGVAEHHELWDCVKNLDCLIMPFQINDIIKDVDPVKLYEYISMGKNVLCIQYEEINWFKPYVFFYKTQKEFFQTLNKLMSDRTMQKYTREEQVEFLMENTWESRYKTIVEYIKNM